MTEQGSSPRSTGWAFYTRFRAVNKWFENRSPVDNSIVSVVEEASAADVDRAVRAAKAALAGPWER
jgi:acyl-CoA reductase-like NAD-dependent aldehyde dehydrogenase